MESFLVDCDQCSARGAGCRDCVVSVLLGVPEGLELDDCEREALATLADGGLLPPLRLDNHPGEPVPWAPAAAVDGRRLNLG